MTAFWCDKLRKRELFSA